MVATPGPVASLTRAAQACGAVIVVGAGVVVLGWAVGSARLVRVQDDLPSLRVNAALCLMAVGVAIVLAARGRLAPVRVIGAVVAVVVSLTLVQWVIDRDLGLDLLVLGDAQERLEPDAAAPGRMSPGGGAALLLLAFGLFSLARRPRAAHAAALGAGLAALLSLVGHLYGTPGPVQGEATRGVALHAAALVLVGAVGLLCLLPGTGLPALLLEGGRVGHLVRQLMLLAVAVPTLVGALSVAVEVSGRYGENFETALLSTIWVSALLALIWWGGSRAVLLERERDLALLGALESRDRLAMIADASRAFAVTVDLEQTLETVTRKVAAELEGGCSVRLVDPTGRFLVPVTMFHPDPVRLEALQVLLNRPIGIDEGLGGQVIRTGAPGLVQHYSPEALDNAVSDPALVEDLQRFGSPSAMVALLRGGGRSLGVITVLRAEDQEPLAQRDLDVLVELAERAAPVIRNAQLVADQARKDAALAELGRLALVTEDAPPLPQVAADLLRDALAAAHVVYLEADGDEALVVGAISGPPDQPSALTRGHRVTAPKPVAVLRTGEPYVCGDMRTEVSAEMVALAEALGSDSGLAVRVAGERGPLGVLTVVARGVGRFTADDVAFVQAFAGLFASAARRLDAETGLREVAEERRVLLDRLVTAEEQERARIADGVHEDQVQVITAADLRLGILDRRARTLAPDLVDDIAFARVAVAGAAERLRDLLFDLQPPDPGVDLADALRDVAAYLFADGGTTCEVTAPADVEEGLSEARRITAYRIAKEALTNAARHAGAACVEVEIRVVDDGLLIRVQDDGSGMARVPERSPAGHRGLSSMHDWAAVSGGWLEVRSAVDRGTTALFWLPCGP